MTKKDPLNSCKGGNSVALEWTQFVWFHHPRIGMVRVATILNGIDFEIAFRMKDDSMEKVREDFMCAWGWLNHMFLYCKSTKNPKELL